MSRGRKILILIGVLVVAVAAAIVFVLTNINSIVKSAIEHYGSAAAKTSVRVSSVSIKLTEGSGIVEGLTVANPRGFSSPHVLSFGSITVRIEPRTVTSGVVVIDEVRITAPQVVYEMNDSGVSNVDILKKNIESQGPSVPKRSPGDGKAADREKRLRIKKLIVESARADVRVAGLAEKQQTLKKIEITDIGGHAGATPEQATRQILSAILSQVTNEVGRAGAKRLLQKGAERALERYQGK
jgi:uncharacterized protein involved in outer membrane biogenesis